MAKKKAVKSKKKVVVKTSKKKTTAKAKSEKVFYVGVTEPLAKQRDVLHITADYLRMLQNVEHLKVTREKKKTLISEFHKVMKEIRSDASELYQLLPKYDVPKKAASVVKAVEAPVKSAAPAHAKVAVKTEIDSLEAELAAIEGRLGSLN